ncbi:hypothetical protein GTA51_13070 [Desulfovibrio aerotolerans]|uniref:MucR family transcriptional regulator n=1 Tax=Solidesulfovibrio aerotolerans TaxID=295255 RepID=A0A7C9IUW7_9BACT|nr:MucR family transcriptional regulator [Solidesulfovibrio aerotolerans]MYL84060.1 hypothetical protein [Solidesulfovibrio aerotolerans]
MINDTLLLGVMASHPGMSAEDTLAMVKTLAEGSYRIQSGIINSKGSAGVDSSKKDDVVLKVNPKKAIGKDKIKCCVCGKEFSMLTKAHLAEHNYTREAYLNLCGYDKKTKLVSKNLAAERKATTEKSKPWEQTPQWKKKQAKEALAKSTAETTAEVVQESPSLP